MVKALVRNTIGSQMLWLALGVLCIAASLALSYHRSQLEAQVAMEMRKGPPPVVPVTDVDPVRQAAESGELSVMASFAPETGLPVVLGGTRTRQDVVAVPLFAVRPAQTAEIAEAAGLRPVPRPDTMAMPERALGLAIFAPDAFEGFLAANRAAGRTVTLALNGPRLTPDQFPLETVSRLAASGVDLRPGFPILAPWAEGRTAAFAPPPEPPLRRQLLWVGLVAILVAMAISFRPEEDYETPMTRPKVARAVAEEEDERFDPIVGQDDIRRGAMQRLRASERAQGRRLSKFAPPSLPGAKIGAGWIRSRR